MLKIEILKQINEKNKIQKREEKKNIKKHWKIRTNVRTNVQKKKKDTKNALKAWNGIKKKLIKILKNSMEKINCSPISICNLSRH